MKLFIGKKLYEYAVIYSVPNGIGRICITRDRPIKSYSDLQELDKFISEKNDLANLFVINYKLLRTFKNKGDNNA